MICYHCNRLVYMTRERKDGEYAVFSCGHLLFLPKGAEKAVMKKPCVHDKKGTQR